MKIPVTFTESECRFTPQFGAVVQIGGGGDGGDYQEGYADGKNAGIEEGKQQGYNIGYDEGRNSGLTDGYTEGFEEGKQAEYDRFWDGIQNKGNRTHYFGGFYMAGGLDDWFYPKYDLNCTNCNSMFRGIVGTPIDLAQRLEACGVVLDTSKATDMIFPFAFCTGIKRLPHISFESVTAASNMSAPFRGCTTLKTIDKVTLSRHANFPSTAFENCTALENITFDTIAVNGLNLSWCPLTHDSLMNTVNALEDKTSVGGTWAVTLGATNLAKLTDTEKAIATNKGWTLA